MKTYFILLWLVVNGGFANAATQTALNQDKPSLLYVKTYSESRSATFGGYTWGYPFGFINTPDYLMYNYAFEQETINEQVSYNDGQPEKASCQQNSLYYRYENTFGVYSGEFNLETNVVNLTSSLDLSSGVETINTAIVLWSEAIASSASPFNWSTNYAVPLLTATNPGASIPVQYEHCDIGAPLVDRSLSESNTMAEASYETKNYDESYVRKAQMQLKFKTGGKATSRLRQLYGFAGISAWKSTPLKVGLRYKDIQYISDGDGDSWATSFYPFEFPNQVLNPVNGNYQYADVSAVGPADIRLGGYGAARPGGLKYVVLPDNADVDVTPYVAGADYCTFIITPPEKYTASVSANGTTLDPDDFVSGGPQICVGQLVNATVNWQPALPGDIAVNYDWFFQPDYINKIVDQGTNQSQLHTIDVNLKTNNPTSLWWYDGGQKMAGCNCLISTTNGEPVGTITPYGFAAIYRPTLSGFTNISPASAGAFMWRNGNALAYGNVDEGTNGMDWKVRINSKYDGRSGLTQVFKAHYWVSPTLLPDPINTLGSFGAADAAEFYDVGDVSDPNGTSPYQASWATNAPGLQLYEFSDYPSITYPPLAVLGEIKFADAADYIRFKPGLGQNDGNIYVTLGVVHWQADGKYNCTPLVGGWDINNTPTASSPDGSDDFPIWTSIQHTKGN